MKVAVLGDLHWGCRNDLIVFHKHQEIFFKQFIDDLKKHNIKHVIQLGDLFDRRKYINFRTLNEAKRIFFNLLEDAGVTLYTLVGNHDIHFRESMDIVSTSLLLGEYSNIHVYTEPATLTLDNTTFDMIPWVCSENEAAVNTFIKSSKSDICCGHFEIEGFAMYRGIVAQGGMSVKTFDKYEQTWSGHYHTRSNKGSITYVGTPYELTWQDYNDTKGYHIFDTTDRSLTFVPNTNKTFVRLQYDDTQKLHNLDDIDLQDRFVRLVVVSKTDLYKFDQFISKLYSKKCYELKVVEDLTEFHDGEISEETDLEDTTVVMDNYIDSVDTDFDKDRLKLFIKSLYVEAINMGV